MEMNADQVIINKKLVQPMEARKLSTRITYLAEQTLINTWNIDDGSLISLASISHLRPQMTAPNGCKRGVEELDKK